MGLQRSPYGEFQAGRSSRCLFIYEAVQAYFKEKSWDISRGVWFAMAAGSSAAAFVYVELRSVARARAHDEVIE
jgi:hypothetical protein